jgi:formylmethanofuran dehydrogenase subunit E
MSDEQERLQNLLREAADLHHHLCPRQVLGVRMGMYAGQLLSLDLPQTGKRLLTIMETDGCGADGVSVAANCWIGHRTLRIIDYGKVAATFIDTKTETAVRIAPHPLCRERALAACPDASNRWQGYLLGYQRLDINDLLIYRPVQIKEDLRRLISRAGYRANCEVCGEEILNEREVFVGNRVLCRACAEGAYYEVLQSGQIDRGK